MPVNAIDGDQKLSGRLFFRAAALQDLQHLALPERQRDLARAIS